MVLFITSGFTSEINITNPDLKVSGNFNNKTKQLD